MLLDCALIIPISGFKEIRDLVVLLILESTIVLTYKFVVLILDLKKKKCNFRL